jgi:tRNA-2-methylthio-N6-dimethylallyladenosine synthase
MTPVFFNGKQDDIGKVVKVKINDSNRNSLFGELINISKKKVA